MTDFSDEDVQLQGDAGFIRGWVPVPKFQCPCGSSTAVWRVIGRGEAARVCAGCGGEIITTTSTVYENGTLRTTTVVTTGAPPEKRRNS